MTTLVVVMWQESKGDDMPFGEPALLMTKYNSGSIQMKRLDDNYLAMRCPQFSLEFANEAIAIKYFTAEVLRIKEGQ